jgi:histidinol-phosphate aminotransferase
LVNQPLISRIVADLPVMVPFVGPESIERSRGRAFRARLGANESAFGPSPTAIVAMREAAQTQWKYCEPENYELREALARFHGVKPANIVIGEGIDGLLGLAVRIASDPGTPVVTSDGAYPTFNFHVAANGARLVKVPFRADREDLQALLDTTRREAARILYISNPNNPMGSWWTAAEIERLIEKLPGRMVLLLDEAYADTAPVEAIPALDVSHPQVLRFRTFSKAYGLAGARIGYAIGAEEMIALFEKVRNHYGINRVAQIGALAALADQQHLAAAVAWIARQRDRIAAIARDNGLVALPSATNFVAIDCGGDGAYAAHILAALTDRDIFIRKPIVPPLERTIRISCGTDAELDVLAEALPDAVRVAQR